MKKVPLIVGLSLITLIAGVCFADFAGELDKLGIRSLNRKNVRIDGWVNGYERIIDYATTTTARTVTISEAHGAVIVIGEISNDPCTVDLPAGVNGMKVTVVDMDATAAADAVVNPDDDDKILGQSDGVSYNATGDAVGESATFVFNAALGAWCVTSKVGTWTQGS